MSNWSYWLDDSFLGKYFLTCYQKAKGFEIEIGRRNSGKGAQGETVKKQLVRDSIH